MENFPSHIATQQKSVWHDRSGSKNRLIQSLKESHSFAEYVVVK